MDHVLKIWCGSDHDCITTAQRPYNDTDTTTLVPDNGTRQTVPDTSTTAHYPVASMVWCGSDHDCIATAQRPFNDTDTTTLVPNHGTRQTEHATRTTATLSECASGTSAAYSVSPQDGLKQGHFTYIPETVICNSGGWGGEYLPC